MSRRHSAEKRLVLPDAKFGDIVLTKFMNSLMLHGKKSTAESIVYGALDKVEDKLKKSEGVITTAVNPKLSKNLRLRIPSLRGD